MLVGRLVGAHPWYAGQNPLQLKPEPSHSRFSMPKGFPLMVHNYAA